MEDEAVSDQLSRMSERISKLELQALRQKRINKYILVLLGLLLRRSGKLTFTYEALQKVVNE